MSKRLDADQAAYKAELMQADPKVVQAMKKQRPSAQVSRCCLNHDTVFLSLLVDGLGIHRRPHVRLTNITAVIKTEHHLHRQHIRIIVGVSKHS